MEYYVEARTHRHGYVSIIENTAMFLVERLEKQIEA